MPEKKEIELFKPSKWLYIFLFIYYSIWLLEGFRVISYYWTYGFDSFRQNGLWEWVYLPVYILSALYSLYAVVKTLRGDSDCITALKWALIIVLIKALSDEPSAQIATYNIAEKIAIVFACPLFYLVFYLYLCFARGIKRRYPKKERRFAPSGWIWTGILILYLIIGILYMINLHKVSRYCRRVEVSHLNLKAGEISDGYVLFSSDRNWEEWAPDSMGLKVEERINIQPYLMSMDSLSTIYLLSGECNKPDARTHNQIIVALLNKLQSKELKRNLKETSLRDTIINGNRLMATTFETTGDSIPSFFTVMNITDSESPKCGVFVRIDKGSNDAEWSVNLARSVCFDLQHIHKCEDNKKRNDTQDNHTHRTGYGGNQELAYLRSTIQKGIFPRFLICVMNAQNSKRVIADTNCYEIFNNLQIAHIGKQSYEIGRI